MSSGLADQLMANDRRCLNGASGSLHRSPTWPTYLKTTGMKCPEFCKTLVNEAPTCEGPSMRPILAVIERVAQPELYGPQVSRPRMGKVKSFNIFLMRYQVYCVT